MPHIVVDARSVHGGKSGIGNYVHALVRHLVPIAKDYRFTLLRHPSRQSPIVSHELVRELTVAGDNKSVRPVFLAGRHCPRDADLFDGPADIVPLGLPCPFVVTLHDMMWVEAPQLASSFLPTRIANGLWYRSNFRRTSRTARRIIAISQATSDAIGRVFPQDHHKVRVVHHGISRDDYNAEVSGPRERLNDLVSAGVRFSLIVGQGSPYKNHPGILRAFLEATADDPMHKLVIVRRFSRIDREMNALLAAEAVRRKIILLSFVPDEQLLALYCHASILLFASHYEGFGLPALEAMRLGTPVLASTYPAVTEIIGDGALHGVSTEQADIVRQIRRLDSDTALRSQLIERGKQRCEQFRWENAAQQTLAVYREAPSG